MPQDNLFRFGIEIELLLESNKKKHDTWGPFAEHLSKLLAKAGVPNHVHGGKGYGEWSIVKEITVENPQVINMYQHGIELVSPIYTSTTTSITSLQTTLTTIFKTLTKNNLPPIPTPRASSHIHISRTTRFSARELAALAKAALHFEAALDTLMPPDRRSNLNSPNAWAKSNRSPDNPALAGLSLAACLAKVDSAAAAALALAAGGGDTRPIIEAMNLNSHLTSSWGKSHKKTAPFIRGKTYKWNFGGLLDPCSQQKEDEAAAVRGTVEFRQPPGSVGAADAMGWVGLGVAFVAGAVELSAGGMEGWGLGRGDEGRLDGDGDDEGGSVGELWELLEVGRGVLGWGDAGVLLKGVLEKAKGG